MEWWLGPAVFVVLLILLWGLAWLAAGGER